MRRAALAILAAFGAAAASAQEAPAGTDQVTVEGRIDVRPRLGRLFVSPMGEPFRGGDHPEQAWFAGADTNHDGQLSRSEFIADAMRFFAKLDVDHNNAIGPTEIEHYEQEILPEIGSGGDGGFGGPPDAGATPNEGEKRGGMGGRRGGAGGPPGGGMGGRPRGERTGGGAPAGGRQSAYKYHASGAGRFGYIATPEPVTAADTDLNRSVTDKEFVEAAGRRFALLDTDSDGKIEAKELPKLQAPRLGRHGKDAPPSPDAS